LDAEGNGEKREKHEPFHLRPPSKSTGTVESFPSRAKRSAAGLSARYVCALASASAFGAAFFRSSGLRPRMPVVARLAFFSRRPKPRAEPSPANVLPAPEEDASTVAGKRRWNTRTNPCWPAASTRVHPPWRETTLTDVFSGSEATVFASAEALSFSS